MQILKTKHLKKLEFKPFLYCCSIFSYLPLTVRRRRPAPTLLLLDFPRTRTDLRKCLEGLRQTPAAPWKTQVDLWRTPEVISLPVWTRVVYLTTTEGLPHQQVVRPTAARWPVEVVSKRNKTVLLYLDNQPENDNFLIFNSNIKLCFLELNSGYHFL